MTYFKNFVLISLLLLLFACHSIQPLNTRIGSRDNNACKTLVGRVVVYVIFVDSKYTCPWSEYDIRSTLDSVRVGMEWIKEKAKSDSINLEIEIAYQKDFKGMIPLYNEFSKKTLSQTLFRKPISSGIKDIYKWADKIAIDAGKSLPKDTSYLIKTQNKITDRERLIARLRDIYKTDNIALMYFIDNYYKNEISVTFDTNSNNNIEFSIVSFKYPAVIAHEFLHLFGAWDLYITPFDKNRNEINKKKLAMELFPNEIMAFPYRNIQSLEISQFTRYTIGWDRALDKKYSDLIFGRKIKPLKY